MSLRLAGRKRDGLTVVRDLQRVAICQGVRGLGVRNLDPQAAAPDQESECEPGEAIGEYRREAEHPSLVSQATETADQRNPRSGQRRDMQPVPRVVLKVAQVHQRGFAEVVESQLEVTNLGGDSSLRAG